MNSNVKQVSSIVLFNTIVFYILLQTCNKPGDWGEKPLSNQDALYFISTTMSTAGYGDITPKLRMQYRGAFRGPHTTLKIC